MEKQELREVLVVYCDYCSKEITDDARYCVSESDSVTLQFCYQGDKSCLVKYKKSLKK